VDRYRNNKWIPEGAGSGQATPDQNLPSGVNWNQTLSLIPPSAPIGSLDNARPTTISWEKIVIIGAQAIVCVTTEGIACGVGAILSQAAFMSISHDGGPPTYLNVSDYTVADFVTGSVLTQSIVNGPGVTFGLDQDGTIAFGARGDASLDNSVQAALVSNLGPSGILYLCCNGWMVSGSGAEGESFTAANEFQVTNSGTIGHVDVAIGYVSGVNSFYVDIDTDNGGIPGATLMHIGGLSSSQPFGGCCGLVSFDVSGGPSLIAGVNYWLVAGPTDTTSTTWEMWNLNIMGFSGLDLFSTDGGQTWMSRGQQTLGAFDILSASSRSVVKK
jgi:hypothetical protein